MIMNLAIGIKNRLVFAGAAVAVLCGFFAVNSALAAAPVLTLNGDTSITLANGSAYNEQGAQCLDVSGNQLAVIISGTVDALTAARYIIDYDCQDNNGNNAERIYRTVTVNAKPANSAGSGFLPTCINVVYGEWRACANGLRSRTMTSLDNVYCAFTAQQVAGEQGTCSSTAAVLGVKVYSSGTLLRTPNNKIYALISTTSVLYIPDQKSLRAYKGHEIFNVSAETLAKYQQVLGVKIYADGTLLRGPDHKIYVIISGKKHHILDLAELREYRGHKIINVSDEVLAQY